MNILLTGSNGFVGARVVELLDFQNVVCALRRQADPGNESFENEIAENTLSENQTNNKTIAVGDMDGTTNWAPCFNPENKINTVIHCAARVHIMDDDAEDPLSAFREVNVEGAVNLARQAALAGVKRFIFLSSIKVNGEFSDAKVAGKYQAFTLFDKPAPEDAYGISKLEAEEALKKICAETGMEYLIIRPPLVYGPGVKANFFSMLKWVSRGVPLPLGGIKGNKRSLVFVDNLVDLIKTCIEHPAAANQTFLVADDDDVSTRELLVRVAAALGLKSRLLNIPPSWLGLAGKLLGKKDIEQRLCASLQVDIAHTKSTLNWTPPYSMEEGLKQTADWYKARS